ncbi:PhzF family phenazine biosynthesis protein [Paracoccus sp. (in: a-proteobacteria)]|uniref:PhzF family phenazine biosynthesis protein n=1 Tax=Paracoccus sp. TaxID=267 RepID=UPI003A898886
MAAIQLKFSLVDVFTRERFSGNQVAVIHDARALDSAQMQNVAREFGFSETTFILPPGNDHYHARVRIFTPHEEVPFAGHPNIGTVFVMGGQKTAASGALPDLAIFDEKGDDVRVQPIREEGQVVGAEIEAPQSLRTMGAVPAERMARCLGLDEDCLVLDRIAPCVASVGLPFAFVELRDLDALASLAPDAPSFREAAEHGPRTVDGFAICAFVVVSEGGGRFEVRSRVVCPLGHPPEDAATGSASGALAALLADASGQGEADVAITQGVEMGRRSEIDVSVPANGGPARIRGYCTHVATGAMTI